MGKFTIPDANRHQPDQTDVIEQEKQLANLCTILGGVHAEGGSRTTDTEKMTLFLQCMPHEVVREVRLLQMTSPGGEVSYVEFFAKLQDRFGVEHSADAHCKWSEGVLPPSGKLSVND